MSTRRADKTATPKKTSQLTPYVTSSDPSVKVETKRQLTLGTPKAP